MPDWLVARTQLGCERLASERIGRLGFDCFCPRFRKQIENRRTRRKHWRTQPLYANYLFVKSPKLHFFLRDIEGITAVVMAGVVPARSETLDQAISLMQQQLVDGFVALPEAVQEPVRPRFVPGQTIRFTTGPLTGHTAVVAKIKGNRVRLLTKMLGREVLVWYREQDLGAEQANNTSPGGP